MVMKTIKKIAVSFIAALSVLSLCGCTGKAYGSSDKQKLEAEGRGQLEEYFTKYLPDAKLLSVEAVSANREMTLKTLTNYVQGNYSENGQTYEYYFNIDNQKMFTSKNYSSFEYQVKRKVLGDFGLQESYSNDKAVILYPQIKVYLPDMREIEDFNSDIGEDEGKLPPAGAVMPYSASVYPIEAVEDPEAYICARDRKEIIDVSMVLAVDSSENTDLTDYSFDDFYYMPQKDNLFYRYLCIHNAISITYPRIGYGAEPDIISGETLTAGSQSMKLNSYTICYEIWDTVKSEETEKQDVIYRKTEQLDTNTGNITTTETGDNRETNNTDAASGGSAQDSGDSGTD